MDEPSAVKERLEEEYFVTSVSLEIMWLSVNGMKRTDSARWAQ